MLSQKAKPKVSRAAGNIQSLRLGMGAKAPARPLQDPVRRDFIPPVVDMGRPPITHLEKYSSSLPYINFNVYIAGKMLINQFGDTTLSTIVINPLNTLVLVDASTSDILPVLLNSNVYHFRIPILDVRFGDQVDEAIKMEMDRAIKKMRVQLAAFYGNPNHHIVFMCDQGASRSVTLAIGVLKYFTHDSLSNIRFNIDSVRQTDISPTFSKLLFEYEQLEHRAEQRKSFAANTNAFGSLPFPHR